MPDIQQTCVGHEDDRDEAPCEVLPRVFRQSGQFTQAQGEGLDMGFYVALIAFQVEALLRLPLLGWRGPANQPIQRLREAWNA